MRPRGSLHEFQQIEKISILVDISKQASFNSLWWIFAQSLEVFFYNFDEIVDLVLDFFLVYPSKMPVPCVNNEYEILWVVFAYNVIIHRSGEGFWLFDQHDQKGLIFFVLVRLLKWLLIHDDFLYFRPIFVLDLNAGSVVTCIEKKLVQICWREVVRKDLLLSRVRVLIWRKFWLLLLSTRRVDLLIGD